MSSFDKPQFLRRQIGMSRGSFQYSDCVITSLNKKYPDVDSSALAAGASRVISQMTRVIFLFESIACEIRATPNVAELQGQ